MASLVDSEAAFKSRAAEVGLTDPEVNALLASRVNTLARFAFAIVPPGQTASDDAIRNLFLPAVANAGTISSARRLIFEAHSLLVAQVKQKIDKTDDGTAVSLAPAEREHRIENQRGRLQGLRLRGEEECSHASYNLVLQLQEKDSLMYLHPEKFTTRRQELAAKKPPKELSLDSGHLTIKDKDVLHSCSTATELEVTQALRRRALAFDLIGLCSYNSMNGYHTELLQHMQEEPPPGYSKIGPVQILRADRAAFLKISENLSTLRVKADGTMPLTDAFNQILRETSVAFHLLPLPVKSSSTTGEKRASEQSPTRNKKLKSEHESSGKGKSRGAGKGKRSNKNRGPNVPKALIGKKLETNDGKRICWPFNLPGGCKDAPAGGECPRGVHVCCEPGCSSRSHGLQNHK